MNQGSLHSAILAAAAQVEAIGLRACAFDEQGLPRDKELSTRLSSLGMELVLRCKQMRPKRRAP